MAGDARAVGGANPRGERETGLLLRSLLEVSLRTVQVLEEEEPEPGEVEALLQERSRLFSRLQMLQPGGGPAPSPKWRPLVEEILRLDRRCMELADGHLERVRGRLDQVKLRRRTLTAYGWMNPELGFRGSFVDQKNR